MKNPFNAIDEKIVRTLYQEGIPMTLGGISSKTKISWITVRIHINKLLKMGVVEEINIPDRKTPKIIMNFNEYGNLASATA